MRPLTQSELIQALLEAGQPHAVVEVQLEVEREVNFTCASCGKVDKEMESREAKVKVVGVRSALNKIILEVIE